MKFPWLRFHAHRVSGWDEYLAEVDGLHWIIISMTDSKVCFIEHFIPKLLVPLLDAFT
ncbi:Hypothetical predicted protein, partial [Prunus dulcis]